MSATRIERRLPEILADIGTGPHPEYTDALLARTASARQRPGWVFPERWLPMRTISTAAAAAPRIPWRVVGVAALLVLALVASAVFVAGNRSPDLPAPFGPAANGLLAYSADGDIYTVDPATGQPKAIVTGPDIDSDPVWSLDGSRLVFERAATGEAGGRLHVARADGSGITAITPRPMLSIRMYSFSPEGQEVLFVSDSPSSGNLSIAKTDGSGMRTLDLGVVVSDPTYRPPEGAEIVFSGRAAAYFSPDGIYVVNADGSGLRTLVTPARDATGVAPRWSPDGSLIAYDLADMTVAEWTSQTHIMSADGSGDRTLPAPTDALWSGGATWSNDGTRLALMRGYSPMGDEDSVLAVVPVDGSGPGVETERSLLAGWPLGYLWAPDDSSVLVMPKRTSDQPIQPLVVDPPTGTAVAAPWEATSGPAWQRLALDDR